MKKTLNPEELQRLATEPEYSVYVNASAGSGKTKVLIDRILRLLLSGSKIESILCVAFTNAAAVEILERLQAKLFCWATCNEQRLLNELLILIGDSIYADSYKLLARARSLYMQFMNAQNVVKIQTLHSFCMRIISNMSNYDTYRHGNVNIMSSTDKAALLKRAIDLVFADAEHNQRLHEALNILASIFEYSTLIKKVEDIFSNKIQLLKHIEAVQYGLDTHAEIQKRVYGVLGITELQSLTKEELIIREIRKWPIQLIIETVSKILSTEGGITSKVHNWCCIDIEQKCRQFDSYTTLFLTKDGKKRVRLISSKTAKIMPDVIEVLSEHQNRIFELVRYINAIQVARSSCAFTQFIREVFFRSEILKAEAGFIDYDDILIDTLYHVSPANSGWWRWYLDCKIEHILIDEAQDLSMLQWQVINLLSEEFFVGEGAQESNRTIFIVGDHKQSIFGFQGADPKLFRDMCQYYRNKAQHAQKLWREVDFNISFRSSVEVLRFIDVVFSTPEYFQSLGLNCAYKHIPWRNVPGAVYVHPLVDCHVIDGNSQSSAGWTITRSNGDALVDSKALLAAHMAQDICSIRQRHTGDESIMVLFRKRGELYDLVIEECKNLGIPVTTSRNIQLIDSVIVQDLIAAARFIVSPYDDFNLAMLLRSPLVGVSEQDLFYICRYNQYSGQSEGKYGYLWSNIVDASRMERYSVIYNRLQQIILYARDGSLYKFFIALLYSEIDSLLDSKSINLSMTDKCIFDRYVSLYDSSMYVTAEAFLEVVANFEEKILPGGFEVFISWFLQSKDEFVSVEDDGERSVKITTVHAAKGLQAKIVILADASDTENIPYSSVLYEDTVWVLNHNAQWPCYQLDLLKAKHASYCTAENMRLLYVALTRAEDELHIYGRCSARSGSAISGSWYEILAEKYRASYSTSS